MAITPTREQFTEFAHGTRDGEVVMLNLLHFARPDGAGADEGAATESTGAARTVTTATRWSRWSRPGVDVSSGRAGPSTC